MSDDETTDWWPMNRFDRLTHWYGPFGDLRPSLIGAHDVPMTELLQYHEALTIAVAYVKDDLHYIDEHCNLHMSEAQMATAENELRAAVAKVQVAMDLIEQCQSTIVNYFST